MNTEQAKRAITLLGGYQKTADMLLNASKEPMKRENLRKAIDNTKGVPTWLVSQLTALTKALELEAAALEIDCVSVQFTKPSSTSVHPHLIPKDERLAAYHIATETEILLTVNMGMSFDELGCKFKAFVTFKNNDVFTGYGYAECRPLIESGKFADKKEMVTRALDQDSVAEILFAKFCASYTKYNVQQPHYAVVPCLEEWEVTNCFAELAFEAIKNAGVEICGLPKSESRWAWESARLKTGLIAIARSLSSKEFAPMLYINPSYMAHINSYLNLKDL